MFKRGALGCFFQKIANGFTLQITGMVEIILRQSSSVELHIQHLRTVGVLIKAFFCNLVKV